MLTVSVLRIYQEKDVLFDVNLPAIAAPTDAYIVGTLKISYVDIQVCASASVCSLF
jgi:hypothetical protein